MQDLIEFITLINHHSLTDHMIDISFSDSLEIRQRENNNNSGGGDSRVFLFTDMKTMQSLNESANNHDKAELTHQY